MNTNTNQNQDEEVQKELNTPIADPTGVDKKDKEFFELVKSLVKSGKINLYDPETLLNRTVYDALPETVRGKVDLEAINLLSALRQIFDLIEAGFQDTYQIHNQVEAVFYTKERIEKESGDVFII